MKWKALLMCTSGMLQPPVFEVVYDEWSDFHELKWPRYSRNVTRYQFDGAIKPEAAIEIMSNLEYKKSK
jgi:hypothetical protein